MVRWLLYIVSWCSAIAGFVYVVRSIFDGVRQVMVEFGWYLGVFGSAATAVQLTPIIASLTWGEGIAAINSLVSTLVIAKKAGS